MSHRRALDKLGDIPKTAKQSAVLILVYPKAQQLHTVFILRSAYEGVHSSQIGFPGGKAEEYDRDLKATALREANEELNIQPDQLEVLGSLSPLYVPPSNFVINPFIAVQDHLPRFIPDKREVEKTIETPLLDLVGEDKLLSVKVNVQNGQLETKGFEVENKVIWGATAMIVKEFAEVLERVKLPNG